MTFHESAFHPSSHMNRDVRVNMRSPDKLETYFHYPNTYSHQTCWCGDDTRSTHP